jgi:hypothetical protein
MRHSSEGAPGRLPKKQAVRVWSVFALTGALAVLGAITVGVKLRRLVFGPAEEVLVLILLADRTREWWDGVAVYATHRSGMIYPPPTWLVLWPVFGWTGLGEARWIWAGMALVALAALAVMCARALSDGPRYVRIIAFLSVFSMPALGNGLGIGAPIVVLLPLCVGAVLLAARPDATWTSDLAAAFMYDAALADPAIALPFAPALVAASKRVRPVGLAASGYAVLTLIASQVNGVPIATQARSWLAHLERHGGHGYGNAQDWLAGLDLTAAAWLPMSALILGATSAFCWWRRHRDVWLLLGVCALAARVWMAPRIDADGLLIVPLVALLRQSWRVNIPVVVYWSRFAAIVSALVLWSPLHFLYPGSTLGPLVVSRTMSHLFVVTHVGAAFLMLTQLVLTEGRVDRSRVVDRSDSGNAARPE